MLFFLGIAFLSTITLYSAGNDFDGRFAGHIRNLSIAVLIMWLVAHIPPVMIHRVAVPLFVVGLLLLLAVALFGDVSKGARRWLNIGITRIQPSELMKIAMPMMLATPEAERQLLDVIADMYRTRVLPGALDAIVQDQVGRPGARLGPRGLCCMGLPALQSGCERWRHEQRTAS